MFGGTCEHFHCRPLLVSLVTCTGKHMFTITWKWHGSLQIPVYWPHPQPTPFPGLTTKIEFPPALHFQQSDCAAYEYIAVSIGLSITH